MNDVIVVEQLRFALLSDIRTVAETLNRISDGIDAELASASPNLDSLQGRFLEIATTLATRTHLHERIGWPGERITSAPLSFTSVDERDLALEILGHYRHRLATRHIDGVPRAAAHAITKPGSASAHHKQQDDAWLTDALVVLGQIAATQPELTVDDCWARITAPPRRPHLMSTLMVRGKAAGLIEMTDAHKLSRRPINGGRSVRVWRSLICTPGRQSTHRGAVQER